MGDATKTTNTFPVIDGARFAVPPDDVPGNDQNECAVVGQDRLLRGLEVDQVMIIILVTRLRTETRRSVAPGLSARSPR